MGDQNDENVQKYVNTLQHGAVMRGAVNGLQSAISTFSKLQQARADHAQSSELNALKIKSANLDLDRQQNDPAYDPAIVDMKRAQLKLGAQQDQTRMEIVGKQLEEKHNQVFNQAQFMQDQIKKAEQYKNDNPDLFGNLKIDPETGALTTGKSSDDALVAKIASNNYVAATKQAAARGQTANSYSTFYSDVLKAMHPQATPSPSASGAVDGSGTGGQMVQMTGPDGSVYNIPSANADKAKARGFSSVQ